MRIHDLLEDLHILKNTTPGFTRLMYKGAPVIDDPAGVDVSHLPPLPKPGNNVYFQPEKLDEPSPDLFKLEQQQAGYVQELIDRLSHGFGLKAIENAMAHYCPKCDIGFKSRNGATNHRKLARHE